MFLQDKVNNARYITTAVNSVLLPFIWQGVDVIFQQNNARPHTAAATQRALRGVQLPWPAWTPDLSPIERVWDMMKRELFLQSLPKPLPNCDNGCKMLGKIYRRIKSGTYMNICLREYTPALPQEGLHCVLMWLFGHPLLWHVYFICSEFVTNDN